MTNQQANGKSPWICELNLFLEEEDGSVALEKIIQLPFVPVAGMSLCLDAETLDDFKIQTVVWHHDEKIFRVYFEQSFRGCALSLLEQCAIWLREDWTIAGWDYPGRDELSKSDAERMRLPGDLPSDFSGLIGDP